MYDPIFITNYLYNHPEIYPFVGIKLCFIIYYIQVIYTLLVPHLEVIRVSRCRPHWNIFLFQKILTFFFISRMILLVQVAMACHDAHKNFISLL
jgi:hypothetical protein